MMRTLFPELRRAARWLGTALGLVLLLGLVVGGVHQHERDRGSHPCAICSLSHAPATTTVRVVAAVPVERFERVAPRVCDAPRTVRLQASSSRAPPQA